MMQQFFMHFSLTDRLCSAFGISCVPVAVSVCLKGNWGQ